MTTSRRNLYRPGQTQKWDPDTIYPKFKAVTGKYLEFPYVFFRVPDTLLKIFTDRAGQDYRESSQK